MNAEENTPKEYNGKQYTKYEALQKQRRMETVMRAQRQKIKLLEDGGADEDDIIAARCKYRGISAEYARFSKAMNLKQQRDRVTVDGLGNIGVGKYTHKSNIIVKKQLNYSSKSSIIKRKPTQTQADYKDYKFEHLPTTKITYAERHQHETIVERSAFGYVGTPNSFDMNGYLRTGKWPPSLSPTVSNAYEKTIQSLSELIRNETLDENTRLIRYVNSFDLPDIFGVANSPDIVDEINKLKNVKFKGFVSCSCEESRNVFTARDCKIDIQCDAGTHCYKTTNIGESEIILGHLQEFSIVKAENIGNIIHIILRTGG